MLKQLTCVSAVLAACGLAQAQSFTEHFDDTTVGVVPIPATWTSVNVSNGGPGTNPNWQIRTDGLVFAAQAGTGYAFANYNSSTGANPVDNWLVSPIVTWNNGDTLKFWTRTVDRNPGTGTLDFPDAMQVRLATTSTTIGSTQAALLATFTVVALDINPTLSNNPNPAAPSGTPPATVGFPDVWTQYTVTVSGLSGPSQGRFAFRYFTPIDGGPLGLYSNYLGVDEVAYTSNGGGGTTCYANCDNSTVAPCLNVNDFVCFGNLYAAGNSYANCDASTIAPILNVNDFICFGNKFAAGCGANNCSPRP